MKKIRVRLGSVSIPIYPTPSRGSASWTVVYQADGKRARRRFTALEDAKEFAGAQAALIANGQTAALGLSSSDAAAWSRVKELAGPTGRSPEIAIAEYAEAVRLLGDVGLVEAAREYRRRNPVDRPSVTVEQAVKEFLAKKESLNVAAEYLRNLTGQLNRFATAFQCTLGSLSGKEIESWLDRLDMGARTRANHLAAVSNLVTFARSRKYLPRDWDELECIQLADFAPGKVQVYSPEELKKILKYAEEHAPKWVSYLAVRAFAGVRFAEVARLRPENFTGKFIVMDAKITKTHSRRLVPVPTALAAFLRRYPPTIDGMNPAPIKQMGPRLVELLRAAGVQTRHNGFRDSFISYSIASGAPIDQVAETCGNSAVMIRRSYREIQLPDGKTITPRLAKEYFAIRPQICHASVTQNLIVLKTA